MKTFKKYFSLLLPLVLGDSETGKVKSSHALLTKPDTTIRFFPEKYKIIIEDTIIDNWLKGSFPGFDFIPGTILIESMAQCGGAGVKLLGTTDGIFGLVSIEDAEFYTGAKFTDHIKFVIHNIRLSEKIIKQTGIAYVNEKKILKATWMCLKIQ